MKTNRAKLKVSPVISLPELISDRNPRRRSKAGSHDDTDPFDPFRELDRVTEQVLGGVRALGTTLAMDAYRRSDQ
jgi:hypothetical protein